MKIGGKRMCIPIAQKSKDLWKYGVSTVHINVDFCARIQLWDAIEEKPYKNLMPAGICLNLHITKKNCI